MSFAIVAAIGVPIVGSLLGASASRSAASQQADAAAQSDQTQRAQYDQTRADNAPFREVGLEANNKLADLMRSGQFGRRFTTADMNADPVYQNGLQFGLDQGTQGINRQAAAGGSFLSGATLKALTRFGNDYGSTKANESYNRFNADQNAGYNKLAGLSGAGQQANSQVGGAGMNMANQIGQSQQGAGNARASGYIGESNAWQNGLNGAMSAWNNRGNNNMLSTANATSDPLGSFGSQKGWW